MSKKTTIVKVMIPIIIIIAGFLIMKGMTALRTAPVKEARQDPGMIVEVLLAEKTDTTVKVRGTGTVEASEEITIIPQVSGRIEYVAPHFDVGGFFKKGEVLFSLEDSDYKLALEQAIAARAKAEYDLATIESQAKIARLEWDRINKDNTAEPNPLVLYEPQLKSARAALASATASVERALLDLERTSIQAPFNARVRSENIDLGQYVRTGTSVAVISGTDRAEIAVPVPLDDLQWLTGSLSGNGKNAALVSMNVGDRHYNWKGRVLRSTGEIDPKSRMMNLIVEVSDPYGLKAGSQSGYTALASGAFVHVELEGTLLKDVFILPRIVFRDDSTVWVMNDDGKLVIKNVTPVRVSADKVIISEGLERGDKIIVTNISGAANGMKLRVMENEK
jgi:RND family efflux transporter MFP subunit